MDAYIRVSRRGGREGDSYGSPDVQQEAIERWARDHDVQIGLMTREEDVSGAKPVDERGLGRLVRRCETGKSEGIIVHHLDRFLRDHLATAIAVKRLKDANARLIGVADGIDSSQQGNKWLINFASMVAEDYLDRVRENWSAANNRAVQRGVHVSARPPFGYVRGEDSRLVVDPDAAEHARLAFKLRAEGVSYRKIAARLADEGAGRGRWSKNGVYYLLSNRAYLGEARGVNGYVNKNAHEPLVEPQLFAKVQPGKLKTPRNGKTSKQALLGGLITCESCGHKLRVTGSPSGPSYWCEGRYSGGDCGAPAAARIKLVDAHVLFVLANAPAEAESSRAGGEARVLGAREAARQREETLDYWANNPGLVTSLGTERFEAGLAKARDELDDAYRALWDAEADAPHEVPEDKPVIEVFGRPMIFEAWDELEIEGQRRFVQHYVAEVTLAKSDPKRRRWQPIEERVRIRFVGADDFLSPEDLSKAVAESDAAGREAVGEAALQDAATVAVSGTAKGSPR